MQASSRWTPPAGVLGRLCAGARERALAIDLSAIRHPVREPTAFARALRADAVCVIAEIKRRSPSKGTLNDGLSAAERAGAYATGGARALSVLTEPAEFGGSIEDLAAAMRACTLPILKKDFHVEPVQVHEARAFGASALLFIARALGPGGLRLMLDVAGDAGIEALAEVRDERELAWAVDGGATVIGVNCRDLETLEIDPSVHERVLPLIPDGCVAVAESGINARRDVERVARLGADAVLVGSSLSRSGDAASAVAALAGVVKARRAT